MKATCIVKFQGRPDKEPLGRAINVGDVIEGDLARVAIENKWAEPIKEPKTRRGK